MLQVQGMQAVEEEIRALARKLLEEGTVEGVLGYARGPGALTTSPILVKDPAQVERLAWDSTCDFNLARYVPRGKDVPKLAVVAKGCVSRALVHLMVERQVQRENVYVIGVNCPGMLDKKRLDLEFGLAEIRQVTETDVDFTITGKDWEHTFRKEDYQRSMCVTCQHPVPPLFDALIGGDQAKPAVAAGYEDVAEFERKTPDERWEHFTKELRACTRCYACRQACPLCYCTKCFCDQTQPAWFGKSTSLSDVMIFHLVRGVHLFGRCVECGDCNTVCPVNIDLTMVNRKLGQVARERFGFTAGIDLEATPPFAAFKMDDPQEFMEEED